MMHSDPQTHALLMLAESVKQSHGWLRSGLVQPDAQKNGWTNLLMERIAAQDAVLQAIRTCARKKVSAPLDAAMVDNIALLLTSYLHRAGRHDLIVSAERTIPRKRLRPDVSVWKADNNSVPVAVVECKVQMGWSRTDVEGQFETREKRLVGAGVPAENVWHVVGNQGNWARSRPEDAAWGTKWCVLHAGPWSKGTHLHPIEHIFESIARIP